MFNTIFKIVNDPLETKEIIQESFLIAFEQISTFSGNESFGAWLINIVQNQSIDIGRKNRFVIFEEIGYSCETTDILNNY